MNTVIIRNDQMYPYNTLRPIPKGQVQFSKVKFLFSEEWANREKIAQFKQGEALINMPLEDNECFVPSELELGYVTLYVKGYDSSGGSIAAANGVILELVQGSVEGGEPPVPPTPDLYQKLIEKFAEFSSKPPIIGENGNWFLWDGHQYVDSGYTAQPETDETLTIPGAPADAAIVGGKLGRRAQGVISEVTILSPGWKRVAILNRGSSGIASISFGVNGQFGRTSQMSLIGYSGYVSLPGFNETPKNRVCDPYGHPRLWQMVNHVRGENANTTEPERIFRVDKVRLCYPKNRSEIDRDSVSEQTWNEYYNPIHIYFDVHVVADPAFDWSTIKPPPWGQLGLFTSITGITQSDYIQPIYEEITVADEDPIGFDGVVCNTYELELENDTQFVVPGYSKMQELSVEKLYSTRQVPYLLNSGAEITGRKGSVRLLELAISKKNVPFYVQPICENMLVDRTLGDAKGSYGMSITRYANGIYEAHCSADDGVTASSTYLHIFQQFPVTESKAPIVLKAGQRYVVNDAWLQLIPYDKYEEIRDSTNKMPNNKDMTSIHGTDSNRYGHNPTVIEAVNYDRVVARASIYFKGGTRYEGRCFYPQLCREGVEVINPALTSDNPLSLVTRPVPYTPKPTKMLDHNDKQYSRIRGMAYANELRVFSLDYPDITGGALLETSVDFVEAIMESLPTAEGVAY